MTIKQLKTTTFDAVWS